MNGMSMSPHGDVLGFTVVIVGALCTAIVFALAIVFTMRPGETDKAHVKHIVLQDEC